MEVPQGGSLCWMLQIFVGIWWWWLSQSRRQHLLQWCITMSEITAVWCYFCWHMFFSIRPVMISGQDLSGIIPHQMVSWRRSRFYRWLCSGDQSKYKICLAHLTSWCRRSCFCSLWYFWNASMLFMMRSLSRCCWCLLFAFLLPAFSLALAVFICSLVTYRKAAFSALYSSLAIYPGSLFGHN